jgi:hypothetical protein
MISSEVQRTLVKSPPELWAELSDPDALTRHLGDLGELAEIRITRTEPERKVEWQAGSTSGTVTIKPSGWGTKVTLSVTRELPAPDEPAAETADAAVADALSDADTRLEADTPPEPDTPPGPEAQLEHDVETIAPALAAEQAFASEGEAVVPATTPQPESRRGFFARLFRRRPVVTAVAGAEEAPGSSEAELVPAEQDLVAQCSGAADEPTDSEPTDAESQADAESPAEPVTEAPAESSADAPADLAAELMAAEEAAAAEVTAVLTAALDRLGAAHHRPFSRS